MLLLVATRLNAMRMAVERIMIGALIEYDDLRKLSRLGENAQLASVERWAKRVGIRYGYDGRGGIWTTLDAMNAAVGLASDFKSDQYSADTVA